MQNPEPSDRPGGTAWTAALRSFLGPVQVTVPRGSGSASTLARNQAGEERGLSQVPRQDSGVLW